MSSDDGLRPIIRRNLQAHWASIETGVTESGVPDLNGCLPRLSTTRPGVEIWIECKWTKSKTVRFKPLQVGWLMTRVRHGGRAFVAVRRHGHQVRAGYYDELWLFDGAHAGALAQYGLEGAPCIGSWDGGEAKWNWKAFEAVLRTHTMNEAAAHNLPDPGDL